MSASDLSKLQVEYAEISNVGKKPYSVLEYKSASLDNKSNGDSFLMELGVGK